MENMNVGRNDAEKNEEDDREEEESDGASDDDDVKVIEEIETNEKTTKKPGLYGRLYGCRKLGGN